MDRKQLIELAKKLNIDIEKLELSDQQIKDFEKKAGITLSDAEKTILANKAANEGDKNVVKLEDFKVVQTQLQTATKAAETTATQLKDANDKIGKLELAEKKREAKIKVDPLIAAGKIKPVDVPHYMELAENSPELFDKIAPTLGVVVELGERGHSGERNADPLKLSEGDAKKEVDRLVKAHHVGEDKTKRRGARQ